MWFRNYFFNLLGINDAKIEEICESFDIELTKNDIEGCIKEETDISNVGNAIISNLYDRLIDKWSDEKYFDMEKFDYLCEGGTSKFIYDGVVVNNSEELETLGKLKGVKKPKKSDEIFGGFKNYF